MFIASLDRGETLPLEADEYGDGGSGASLLRVTAERLSWRRERRSDEYDRRRFLDSI
jgi:hypothetical protein